MESKFIEIFAGLKRNYGYFKYCVTFKQRYIFNENFEAVPVVVF